MTRLGANQAQTGQMAVMAATAKPSYGRTSGARATLWKQEAALYPRSSAGIQIILCSSAQQHTHWCGVARDQQSGTVGCRRNAKVRVNGAAAFADEHDAVERKDRQRVLLAAPGQSVPAGLTTPR